MAPLQSVNIIFWLLPKPLTFHYNIYFETRYFPTKPSKILHDKNNIIDLTEPTYLRLGSNYINKSPSGINDFDNKFILSTLENMKKNSILFIHVIPENFCDFICVQFIYVFFNLIHAICLFVYPNLLILDNNDLQ